MKLVVKDLYDLTEGLNKLLDKELPVKVAFLIQNNYKKITEGVKPADDIRKKLIEKYKDKENEDGSIQIKKSKMKDYQREYKELMEEEVELDIKPINVSDLGDYITPRTLVLISKIVREDEA